LSLSLRMPSKRMPKVRELASVAAVLVSGASELAPSPLPP
jgi:hypothetical protein